MASTEKVWPKDLSCDSTTSKVYEFTTAQDVLWGERQDLGIAALPRQQAANDSDLVSLPFYREEQQIPLCYTYPKHYDQFKRVTLYGEFLKQKLNNIPFSTDTLSQIPLREIDRRAT